jgi:5'-3' exonuclease
MILIDGNSLGYAGTASSDLRAGEVPTGAVFYIINKLRSLRLEHAGRMIVLWDGVSWRKNVYPEYKANRDVNKDLVKLKEKWVAQKPNVQRALSLLGIAQVSAANMEADDLAARLGDRSADGNAYVTGDKDWLQLLRHGFDDVWLDPIRERRVGSYNFREFTGFGTPFQFVQGKALTGDQGDNIPGVGGIGSKGAVDLIRQFGSISSFFLVAESSPSFIRKLPKKFLDLARSEVKRAAYARNMLLVDLRHIDAAKAQAVRGVPGHLDREGFIDFCAELAFHSIISDVDEWLRPFMTAK